MQTVSIGDNWHEMSNLVFWERYNKTYFKRSSAEILFIKSTLALVNVCHLN